DRACARPPSRAGARAMSPRSLSRCVRQLINNISSTADGVVTTLSSPTRGRFDMRDFSPPVVQLHELERSDGGRRAAISVPIEYTAALAALDGVRIKDRFFTHLLAGERAVAEFIGLKLFNGVPILGEALLLPTQRFISFIQPPRLYVAVVQFDAFL